MVNTTIHVHIERQANGLYLIDTTPYRLLQYVPVVALVTALIPNNPEYTVEVRRIGNSVHLADNDNATSIIFDTMLGLGVSIDDIAQWIATYLATTPPSSDASAKIFLGEPEMSQETIPSVPITLRIGTTVYRLLAEHQCEDEVAQYAIGSYIRDIFRPKVQVLEAMIDHLDKLINVEAIPLPVCALSPGYFGISLFNVGNGNINIIAPITISTLYVCTGGITWKLDDIPQLKCLLWLRWFRSRIESVALIDDGMHTVYHPHTDRGTLCCPFPAQLLFDDQLHRNIVAIRNVVANNLQFINLDSLNRDWPGSKPWQNMKLRDVMGNFNSNRANYLTLPSALDAEFTRVEVEWSNSQE